MGGVVAAGDSVADVLAAAAATRVVVIVWASSEE